MADRFGTGTVIAHPWLCDVLGHMNTRHIMAAFDDAGFALLDTLGFTFGRGDRLGWADVRLEADLVREVPKGAVLSVVSGVARVGNRSFVHVHRLVSRTDEALHAEVRVTTVRFDLGTRRAVPLPEDFASRVEGYLIDDP